MSTSRPRPALSRLARILEVPEGDLVGFEDVTDEELTTLHRQINESLYGEGKAAFARVANLTRTIPSPLAGRLAQRFLPPVLAARVAEQLPPAKARDLVTHVSTAYLVDIAIALDPAGARPIIEEIPAERIGQVARALFDRSEYAAVAEFVRAVSFAGLTSAVEAASATDLAALLPLVEWTPDLDRVVSDLSETRVHHLLDELTHAQVADLATAMDVTPLRPILGLVEADTVAGVARILFDRGDHQAMAELAASVPAELLLVVLDEAGPEGLAAVVPRLEITDDVVAVIDGLDEQRREALLREVDAETAERVRTHVSG